MKIGVFGGAFDPFHSEHRGIIESAHDCLSLDKIVILPSFLPPHKKNEISPYQARRAMVEAGTEGLDYVVIDDIERERGVVNPTSVILPLIKQKYAPDEMFFIMGGDSITNFHKWIEPRKITDTATLAVAYREGCGEIDDDVERVKKLFDAKVVILPFRGEKVSSSAIKASLELGFQPQGISEEVYKVIKHNRLYSRFADLVEEVKSDIPERTFLHCASCAIYAEGFAGLLNLKYEDVFIAAFLHDCAKHLDFEMEGVPKPVVHQFTGADRAKEKYGIEDETILDAIRYHTSGKPDMTKLGKLIYCADMLEMRRDYEGVDELRRIISEDFEKGFVACITRSYQHLLKQDRPIYPLTKECVEYYNKDIISK